MAAARLGYLVGPSWLVAELDKVALPVPPRRRQADRRPPGAALRRRDGDPGEARRGRARADHARRCASCPCDVWPSGANFILFRPRTHAGQAVWQGLLDRSVLVRDCSGWPRLAGCLRVTVGTPAENDAFLAALAEVLA